MTGSRILGRSSLTAVVAAIVTTVIATAASGAGTWSTLAPLPAATEGLQTAVVGKCSHRR